MILLLASGCSSIWAGGLAEGHDQALLWRHLHESRAALAGPVDSPPEASLAPQAGSAAERQRRGALEDLQWRSLLASQQMQRFAPEIQAGARSRWLGQTLDREVKADALSADILQRSRSYLSNARR